MSLGGKEGCSDSQHLGKQQLDFLTPVSLDSAGFELPAPFEGKDSRGHGRARWDRKEENLKIEDPCFRSGDASLGVSPAGSENSC